jgi:hypothetical protein
MKFIFCYVFPPYPLFVFFCQLHSLSLFIIFDAVDIEQSFGVKIGVEKLPMFIYLLFFIQSRGPKGGTLDFMLVKKNQHKANRIYFGHVFYFGY